MRPIISQFAALLLCLSAALASDRVLTVEGLAPVKIGMSLTQAEKALGAKLDVFYGATASGRCGEGRRADLTDSGVFYMVEDGVVARIDIMTSAIRTERGVGVGASEDDIRKAYPQVIVEPHPYLDEEGHYMVVDEPGKKRGLIFETRHGKVTSFRAGRYPAVSYIEGCA